MKTFTTALAALGLFAGIAQFAGTAQAGSVDGYFTDLGRTAPRSVFADIQASAPRSIFDDIRDTAPKSIFDQIRDSAPRSDGVFGSLENSAP